MKNLKYYFNKAKKEEFAIPQFNFSDFTQLKAIVSAAEKKKSPVILGTSEGESNFFGIEEAVAIRNILRNKLCTPIFLNLDHGKSFDYLKKAIDAGYDMVHFDGSKLSLEENIKITKRVVKYAKWRGVLVEGEVGRIATDSSKVYSEKIEVKEEDLTGPSQAKEFVGKTKVDLLAVSIGNFHGVEVSGNYPIINNNRLIEVKKQAGRVFLVLHGGSGVLDSDIRRAVESGITKININTELRMAFSNSLREELNKNPGQIVPYKYLPEAQKSVEKIVEQKITLFDSAEKI